MTEYMDAESIVKKYGSMIFNVALHIVSSREDAEDIYSETFLNYFRKEWQFESEEHRKAWFIRVATNCAYDVLRKRTPDASLDDTLSEIIPYEDKTDIDLSMDVRAAIDRLPPKFRDVIMLHYINDVPVAEIAKILGINENTIKSRLFKARELLSGYLS